MAKSQKNQKNFKALLLGFMGLAGAGVAILLCLSRLGFSSEPVVEETLPPPPENPYTESDFYVQDGFVYCSAVDAKTGIDVSSHQEVIDWATVAQSGVDYAMIRVGYRGYDQGGVHIDSYAEANLQGALDAGLPVGVYFYSQAISVEEAREEAEVVLEFLDGWEITYPVVFDWAWSQTVPWNSAGWWKRPVIRPPSISIRIWRRIPSACGSCRPTIFGWRSMKMP